MWKFKCTFKCTLKANWKTSSFSSPRACLFPAAFTFLFFFFYSPFFGPFGSCQKPPITFRNLFGTAWNLLRQCCFGNIFLYSLNWYKFWVEKKKFPHSLFFSKFGRETTICFYLAQFHSFAMCNFKCTFIITFSLALH